MAANENAAEMPSAPAVQCTASAASAASAASTSGHHGAWASGGAAADVRPGCSNSGSKPSVRIAATARLERARRMRHRQHPLHQVELQTLDRGQGLQRVPDQDLFGRAVHLQDADPAAAIRAAVGGRQRIHVLRGRCGATGTARHATGCVRVMRWWPA